MLKSVSVLKRISAPVVGAFGMASAAGAEPIVIRMPALSPTMEEGSIVRWGAKEGKLNYIFVPLNPLQTS